MRGRRIIAAAGAAIVVAALPSALGTRAVAAASGWTVTPSTQPTVGVGSLHAVACHAGACVAVGAIATRTFAETRSGTGWVIAATPVLPGQSSVLSGVACPSANDCIAVGTRFADDTHASTLIEKWDGTRWRVTPSTNGRGKYNELFGVWCDSPSNCLAVGDSDSSTLIERWNGSAWHVQSSPSPTRRSSFNQLHAVTCWEANGCFATGTEIMDGFDDSVTLVERWDGVRWSIVNTPSPSNGNYSELNSIACSDTQDCVAAGDANYRPIIEQWNGGQWRTALYPSASGEFDGIACATPTHCEVVGFDSLRGLRTESWDGHTWTSPPISVPGGRQLFAIACERATACHTVGASDFGPLTADWNGTAWTATAAARGSATPPNSLAAVSCPSSSSCFAVGSTSAQTGWTHAQVSHWNGHLWAADPSAAAAGQLQGVSCASASSCIALGVLAEIQGTSPISLQWDGTRWTEHFLPLPAHEGSVPEIDGVSCATPVDCMAVGSYTPPAPNDVGTTLAEHWDGARWSIVPTPQPTPNAGFQAVSCAAPGSCTAVGTHNGAVLVERWNGTHWTIADTPGLIGRSDDLTAVSCTTVAHCVAVGSVAGHVDHSRALVVVGDGAQWSVQPTPAASAPERQLVSVACRAANDCTAVGSQGGGSGGDTAVAEHWDGARWSVEAVPPVAHSFGFAGIAVGDGGYVAVGSAGDTPGGALRNLIETHN